MTPALPLLLSLALASPPMAVSGLRGAPLAADARLPGAHSRPPRPLRLALDGPAAPSVELKKGDPAPGDGVWMPTSRAISVADAYSRCDYERQRLRAELAQPPQGSLVPLVAAVVGGLVLGGVAGWSLHAAIVGR